MADTFVIKQNDTRPYYVAQLRDRFGTSSEEPLDLTNATEVLFLMRKKSHGNDPSPQVASPCLVDDAAQGIVTYQWAEGDTDEIGDYYVEFQITWNDGGIETVPNRGYLELTVVDDLGP